MRVVVAEENSFARLDIPIAIFAPEKPVERGGGVAEFVFGQRGGDFANRLVEFQQNPFVIAGEKFAPDFAFDLKSADTAEPNGLSRLPCGSLCSAVDS